MMVGRLRSFWEGLFSGAMWNLQGVTVNNLPGFFEGLKKKTSKKGPLIFIWISPLVPKKTSVRLIPVTTSATLHRTFPSTPRGWTWRGGCCTPGGRRRWRHLHLVTWLSKMLNPTLFMFDNGLGCLWNSNCNFPGKDILPRGCVLGLY